MEDACFGCDFADVSARRPSGHIRPREVLTFQELGASRSQGTRKEDLHVWRERCVCVWQLGPPGALLAGALVAEFVTDAFGDSGLLPRRERRTTRCSPFLNVKWVSGLRNEVLPPSLPCISHDRRHVHLPWAFWLKPFSSNLCPFLCRSLPITMGVNLVEVFFSSRNAWFVASVESTSSEGVMLVQFVDADENVMQTTLRRQDKRVAKFGDHVASRLPPGFQIVPSASRPGTITFMHVATGHRFATVELAWYWYIHRCDRVPLKQHFAPQAAAPSSAAQAGIAAASAATMQHFDSIEGLLAPVRSGALAPLSGRFLVRLAEGGGLLQRRQDLSNEAFWVPTYEAVSIANQCAYIEIHSFFVALSYRWLTPGHPDPARFHLKIVAAVLKDHFKVLEGLCYGTGYGDFGFRADVAMFWDFGSLHQQPRVDYQKDLFKQGLQASNRWYGSKLSSVWLQPKLPLGFSGTSYDKSGWCFVEASISSLIKPERARRDLRYFDVADPSALWREQSGRMPPLTPDRVKSELLHNKKFTNDSDVNKVAKLYREFFEVVSSSVEHLDNMGCDWWTTEHMLGLAEVMPMFPNLKNFRLEGIDLKDEGAAILACALKANRTITILHLNSNNVRDGGAVALAQALKANRAITDLDLNSNNIGDEGAIAMADALKANRALTVLSLHSNNIGDEGAVALAEALKANRAVTQLDLHSNNIGDGGAVAFAQALKANRAVTQLDLHSNNIGDGGSVSLAEALKVNAAVTQLDLHSNNIGDGGAVALAQALKVNRAITDLDLHSNNIGDGGAVALAEALKVNAAVTRFHLSLNTIGDTCAAALAEAVRKNDRLKIVMHEKEIGANGDAIHMVKVLGF